MKIDYNKLMYEEISSFGYRPKLLLHCCCAPCSSAVIERLSEHFDITYLYFNPNIYPESEYIRRRDEFVKLGVKLVSLPYDYDEFLTAVRGLETEREGGARCRVCIALRLKRVFEYAVENNYEVVTTTLSISPHKDAEFINLTGENFEKIYGVKYLHADFKKQNGYLRSIEICREKDVYRQDYCGCQFSINSTIDKK